MLNILEEKISIFEKTGVAVSNGTTLPTDLYRLGSIFHDNGANYLREIEQITQKEWLYIRRSPLAQPSNEYPVYIRDNAGIKVYGTDNAQLTTNIKVNYVKIPTAVAWAANSDTGLYDVTNSVNFELHESEETELVIKILALAGIVIKDNSIYAMASGEDTKSIQQEKA